ncbi:MAG: efflux RND transporter periplasmic adaptor subunit [Rhodomicrobium sp.]
MRKRIAFAALAVFCIAAAPAAAGNLVEVEAVTASFSVFAPTIRLTGTVEAQIQTNIAFRSNGKIVRRFVEVGDRIAAGQVLAKIDPTELQADVDNAAAALDSAKALRQQAQLSFARQQSLIEKGYTTRAAFDQAKETLDTTAAQVESAEAALNATQEQLSYSELKAGVNGIVVSRSAEAGQVVQTGQTIFTVAEDGPRDAVFNIYELLLTRPPRTRSLEIVLQANPAIKTTGTVREISPILDPKSGTVKVKVGLTNTPPEMSLGAAVIGQSGLDVQEAIVLPWSALYEWQGKPAVWVIDARGAVTPKPVVIDRYGTGTLILRGGVEPGERVVTAGIQFLRPGQKVTVTPGETP